MKQEYEPYGDEWANALMKTSKKYIIDLYKGCCLTRGALEEQVEMYRTSDPHQMISELKDFAIWMTGCGYDFTQHKYFIKKRDELLN